MAGRGQTPDHFAANREELAGAPAKIPAPSVERVGVGYRVAFPSVRVEIIIPRVHWHREDPVAIYAIYLLPAAAGQARQRIDHGSLNLHASRTRSTLAKELHPRWPADWVSILEQASAAVLELETMGEEPVELRLMPETLPSPQLLGNICLKDDPTMIFGQGGDGKSYLALAAALSINSGKDLLGIKPAERRRVAYLDWEYSANAHTARMRRMMDLPDLPDLLYFPCRLPLPQLVDRLSVQFTCYGIGYCVIDSVAWACGGAPEESAMATAFMASIRQLAVGALCVAHVNRSGDTNMPFGSVFWHNGMRATWFCKKQQEAGDAQINLGLFNRKANGDRLDRALAFVLDFTGDRTTIAKVDPGAVAELAGQLSVRDRMVAALRSARRPMTYAELAEELMVDVQIIRNKAQQAAFQLLDPAPGTRVRRVALAAPPDQEQTGLETSLGRADEQTNHRGVSIDPGLFGRGLPGEELEKGKTTRCPSCGFDEYQPLGAGRRKCLSCEAVWDEEG